VTHSNAGAPCGDGDRGDDKVASWSCMVPARSSKKTHVRKWNFTLARPCPLGISL
jgi:hypothetical protein